MVHLAVHMHTKNLLKIWLTIKISWKKNNKILTLYTQNNETLPNINHLKFSIN